MDRVDVGEETTRAGNSRDRIEQKVDERKGGRERENGEQQAGWFEFDFREKG